MDEITSVLYWSSVHRAAYPVSRPFGVLELASAVSGGTETSGDLSVNSALAAKQKNPQIKENRQPDPLAQQMVRTGNGVS